MEGDTEQNHNISWVSVCTNVTINFSHDTWTFNIWKGADEFSGL